MANVRNQGIFLLATFWGPPWFDERANHTSTQSNLKKMVVNQALELEGLSEKHRRSSSEKPCDITDNTTCKHWSMLGRAEARYVLIGEIGGSKTPSKVSPVQYLEVFGVTMRSVTLTGTAGCPVGDPAEQGGRRATGGQGELTQACPGL